MSRVTAGHDHANARVKVAADYTIDGSARRQPPCTSGSIASVQPLCM